MAEKKVVVKKVKAFPIAAQLRVGQAAMRTQILKLSSVGMIVDVGSATMMPGDRCEITFETPVFHKRLAEPVVVIKQYNQWHGRISEVGTADNKKTPASPEAAGDSKSTSPSGSVVTRLVELHFTALSSESRGKIVSFLKAAGVEDK